MKKYVSPEASLQLISTADVITLSFTEGVGTASSIDLSKYFSTNTLDMEDGF